MLKELGLRILDLVDMLPLLWLGRSRRLTPVPVRRTASRIAR
jgi:hypothetical protein